MLKRVTDQMMKEQKEMILFKVYVQLLSKMTQQSYISFSDFVAMTDKDTRPEAELFKELEEMEKKFMKEDPDGTV